MTKKKNSKDIRIKILVGIIVIVILLSLGVYLFNDEIAKNKIKDNRLNDKGTKTITENFEKFNGVGIQGGWVVGVWKGIYEDLLVERNNLTDYYLEFQDDGTYVVFDGDYKEDGNYEIENNKIIFHKSIEGLNESLDYYAQVKIDNDEMVLFFPYYPKAVIYRRRG